MHLCSGPYGMQDPNFLANGLLGGGLGNTLGANALADTLGLTQVCIYPWLAIFHNPSADYSRWMKA